MVTAVVTRYVVRLSFLLRFTSVAADVTSAITVTDTVTIAVTGVARVRDAGEKEPFLHVAPRGVAVFQGNT